MALARPGINFIPSPPVTVATADNPTLEAVDVTVGAAVTEAYITTSDVTTLNATTAKHGFLKKLDNDATHYMDGTGAWSTPPSAGGPSSTSVWMPLTTTVSGTPQLVWSGTDSLIPTYGPF